MGILRILSTKIVEKYQSQSQTKYENGRREYYLPCEIELGNHCAKIFHEDIQQNPLHQAILNHTKRCTKGPFLGIAGLISATLMVVIPFSGSCPDACDRLTNSCFDCGANVAREVG